MAGIAAPRFALKEMVFSGAFSVVHRGSDAASRGDVIVKRSRTCQRARQEFNAVSRLSDRGCRNIVELAVDRLVGDQEIAGCAGAHPFYRQGYDHPANMLTVPYRRPPLPCRTDAQASAVMRDVLVGLSDVHGMGYVHCDVKTENVMFDGERHRLIDFGLAMRREEAEAHRKVCGTPFYVAPEVIVGTGLSAMSDVYSAGVMLYALLHGGRHPDREMNLPTAARDCHRLISAYSYDRSHWENESAPLAADLCSRLMQRYPPARLEAGDALSHALFSRPP